MNEVSIIVNGVRYDAVEVQPSEDRCVTCALSEMCFMLDCFPRFCDTFIKIPEFSDMKFSILEKSIFLLFKIAILDSSISKLLSLL